MVEYNRTVRLVIARQSPLRRVEGNKRVSSPPGGSPLAVTPVSVAVGPLQAFKRGLRHGSQYSLPGTEAAMAFFGMETACGCGVGGGPGAASLDRKGASTPSCGSGSGSSSDRMRVVGSSCCKFPRCL